MEVEVRVASNDLSGVGYAFFSPVLFLLNRAQQRAFELLLCSLRQEQLFRSRPTPSLPPIRARRMKSALVRLPGLRGLRGLRAFMSMHAESEVTVFTLFHSTSILRPGHLLECLTIRPRKIEWPFKCSLASPLLGACLRLSETSQC